MLTVPNGEVSGRGEPVLAAGNHLCRNVYDLVALVVTTALVLPVRMVARLWRLPSAGPITACAAVHASLGLFIRPDLPCVIISTCALWFRVLAFPNLTPSARPPCLLTITFSCFVLGGTPYFSILDISPLQNDIPIYQQDERGAHRSSRQIIQIDHLVSSISRDGI